MKYLEQTDRILVRLLSDMSSRELWTEVHGKMHSIKGMAKAMSLPNIAQLGHSLESWCLLFQKGDREAAQEAVQVVIDGTALLKNLVHRMDSVDSAEFRERYHNLMERLSQDPSDGKKEVLLPPRRARKSRWWRWNRSTKSEYPTPKSRNCWGIPGRS